MSGAHKAPGMPNPNDRTENPIPPRNDIPAALAFLRAYRVAGVTVPPSTVQRLFMLQDDPEELERALAAERSAAGA